MEVNALVLAAMWFGAAVCFGFAPGFLLVRWLAPRDRVWLMVVRALFLSPLLYAVISAGLLLAGAPPESAGGIMLGLGLVAGLLAFVIRHPHASRPPLWERRLMVWLIVLGAIVLLPHALREWVRVRSDAWFHMAVVLEMGARGAPPGDPYFAGFQLNYIWIYHALLTPWSRILGAEAWDLGGILNAFWLVSLGGAVYAFSRRVGRPGREAFFAALFVPLGLCALFYLWLPLKLAQALTGETAGWDEVRRVFSLSPLTLPRVWDLVGTFGAPPPFLNKYLVMTAFGGAITGLAWTLEGVAGLVRARSWRGAALTALSLAGTWLWHPGVGIAATLALGLAGGWLFLRPGPVPRGSIVAAAFASAIGLAAALPFLLMTVGRAETGFPLGPSPVVIPIVVASLAALVLGLPALVRLRPSAGSRFMRVMTASLMLASLLVVLPPPNTKDKLTFVFYLLPAIAAGWMLGRLWRGLRARGRGMAAWALVILLLAPVNVLLLAGYLLDPADPPPAAAETELLDWLRDETPPDAVVLDSPERWDLLVKVPRRQYWGRESYARSWGYDPAEMDRRREVRNLLVGPPGAWDPERWRAGVSDPAAGLRVAAALADFAAAGVGPLYVIWRPGDHDGLAADASLMAKTPDRFQLVWAGAEGSVYRYVAVPERRNP